MGIGVILAFLYSFLFCTQWVLSQDRMNWLNWLLGPETYCHILRSRSREGRLFNFLIHWLNNFWLCWFFTAVQGLSLAVSCSKSGLLTSLGARSSHCGGFCCCRAQAVEHRLQYLWHVGSVVVARRPRLFLEFSLLPSPSWDSNGP